MNGSLLSCEEIAISYRGASEDPWRLIIPEFHLRAGDFSLVSGDNMSGKSTFLRFAGGASADLSFSGTLRREGRAVTCVRELDDLSVLLSSEDDMFPELTILENVSLGVDAEDMGPKATERLRGLLNDAGVFRERSLRTPLMELSSGGREVVKFCRAVLSRRPVVLMDEMSSFLDEARAAFVLTAAVGFAAAGRAVVMVSHSERDRRFVAERYPVRRFHLARDLDRSVLTERDARNV